MVPVNERLCFVILWFLLQHLKRDLKCIKKGNVSGALNYGLKFLVTLFSAVPAPFLKGNLDQEAQRGKDRTVVLLNGKCGGRWNVPGCRRILSKPSLIPAPGRLRFTVEL